MHHIVLQISFSFLSNICLKNFEYVLYMYMRFIANIELSNEKPESSNSVSSSAVYICV